MESFFHPSLSVRRKKPRFLLSSHERPCLALCPQPVPAAQAQHSPIHSLKHKCQLPTDQMNHVHLPSRVKVWQRKCTSPGHGLCCAAQAGIHQIHQIHQIHLIPAPCSTPSLLQDLGTFLFSTPEKVQERTNAHLRGVPPVLQPCAPALCCIKKR